MTGAGRDAKKLAEVEVAGRLRGERGWVGVVGLLGLSLPHPSSTRDLFTGYSFFLCRYTP